jgi:hypothetical protein
MSLQDRIDSAIVDIYNKWPKNPSVDRLACDEKQMAKFYKQLLRRFGFPVSPFELAWRLLNCRKKGFLPTKDQRGNEKKSNLL